MLKTMLPRPHDLSAGEPAEADATASRAAWRGPYEEHEPRASDYARTEVPRDAAGLTTPDADAPSNAGVEAFRELARAIEERRQSTRQSAAAPAAPERSRADAPRPTSPRIGERDARRQDERLEALERQVALAAEKRDIARLEEMLTDALRRLAVLEARPPESVAFPSRVRSAEMEESDAEARWAARAERAASPAADPAPTKSTPPRVGSPRRLWP